MTVAVANEQPASRFAGRLLLALVLAALAYALLGLVSDLAALRAALVAFEWGALALAVALVLVGYGLRALRWQVMLAKLGHKQPAGLALVLFLSGLSMGVTPGKLGEAIKARELRIARGTPYVVSMPTIVLERVGDLLAVATLLALGLLLAPAWGLAPAALVLLGVALLVLLLRSERAAAPLLALLRRLPLARRAAAPVAEAHRNMRPLTTPGVLAATGALGLAAWALEATAMWRLAAGLGLDLSWGAAALVFAAGSLAGVLSLLPGGLGVTEGGMVALLAAMGVPLAPATALTLLVRLATLWLGVVVGAVALAGLRVARRGR